MKNKIKNNNVDRTYCRYCIIDLITTQVLISGEKWQKCSSLQTRYEYVGTFRPYFSFRKVSQYFREDFIKGRKCLIVMWANAPQGEVSSNVLSSGCLVGLKGKYYDVDSIPIRFYRFLRVHGYVRK